MLDCQITYFLKVKKKQGGGIILKNEKNLIYCTKVFLCFNITDGKTDRFSHHATLHSKRS